jgi:hypothetical protein
MKKIILIIKKNNSIIVNFLKLIKKFIGKIEDGDVIENNIKKINMIQIINIKAKIMIMNKIITKTIIINK